MRIADNITLQEAGWRPRASSVRARLERYRARPAVADCSVRWVTIYATLYAVAVAFIIVANRNWLASVNDTILLFSSFEMLERFSSPFSSANANPLQALFDLFPSGFRLDTIPGALGRLLFGPGVHVEFFYVSSALMLAGAVAMLARTIGLRRSESLLAGALVPLMLMPIAGIYPLDDHFYVLWPITYYAAAGIVLTSALLWRIDGQSWMRFGVSTTLIVLVLVHLSVVQILFMTLLAPALVATGTGALVASHSRRELMAKLACAALVVLSLVGAGIFHYLYALGVNTASHVFYLELMDFMTFAGPSWDVIRDDIAKVVMNPFTFQYGELKNIDGTVAPLAHLGAIYLAVAGRTRSIRVFGWTLLAWVVSTALTIAFLHNLYYWTGAMYQGPDPRHFVSILWPYYGIGVASLIFALAEWGLAAASRAWPAATRIVGYAPHGLVFGALVAIPVIGSSRQLAGVAPGGDEQFAPLSASGSRQAGESAALTYLPRYPSYQRTPLVEYLESQVAVALDREFRGSVLAMPTIFHQDVRPYKAVRRETTFAYNRAYLGNDLGAFGLRHFNVPTLDEMTHNVTPQFYLTIRELLSRPDIDAYDKHFAMITRLNERIMTLLGLRFIIADYELPIGTERLAMALPTEIRSLFERRRVQKSPVRVYELADPNVGQYSPTTIVRASTAREMLVAMAAPTFDGRHTVVTDDESLAGPLVPATAAAMTVREGGVALRASSTGQSVIVLPVQFSHCWQIVAGTRVSLFRANLMQLGVRFSGDAWVELRQIFGPFWQSSCRLADANDIERLRMAEARGAGAEPSKVRGDGVNLIAAAETFEAAIGPSPLVSVTAAASPDVPARTFTVAASGGLSEHYAAITVPNLTPGPYTLSLQVRTDAAPWLSLQINDGGNGLLADYLLPTGDVWLTTLGNAERLHATVHRIDEQWSRLTLTSTVSTTAASVFIQLKDSRRRGTFTPDGEAVSVRALKFERGEVATPYPGFDEEGAVLRDEPGDGVNLVPAPEALHTAIASTPIARFEPIAAAAAPASYRITASGPGGEHYSVFSVPDLAPGPYTLSMQVRSSEASRLYLQLIDGTNGALGDFDLSGPGVTTTTLGRGQRIKAAVTRADENWLQLSLTTTLEGMTGYVIVQLADEKGSRSFLPRGETATIRAVKLERGPVATPFLTSTTTAAPSR